MSIEKLTDTSKVYIENNPYVQILNIVVEHIKDNDAFRMYVYLSAKSRDWKVAKEWTAKKCGVGIRKAKQCWSYLERCGLIQYIRMRNEHGSFTQHDLKVLNGSKFNPNEPFLKESTVKVPANDTSGAETAPVEKLSTETGNQWCNNPPGGEPTRVDSAPQLNKDSLQNKDVDTKERKSSCASAQKKRKSKSQWEEENAKRPDWAEKMDIAAQSKEQMANEAKHIEEHEAIKRAPMPDYLKDMVKNMKMAH